MNLSLLLYTHPAQTPAMRLAFLASRSLPPVRSSISAGMDSGHRVLLACIHHFCTVEVVDAVERLSNNFIRGIKNVPVRLHPI